MEDTRYFAYDLVGNLVSKIDRNGRETEFLYDNLHRLVEETWLDGQTVVRTIAYEWDAAGQLLSVDDADADYEYAYDPLGRVIEIMADVGSIVVLTQGFDAVGNRTSLSAEFDEVADFLNEYKFDALGRNTRIEQAGQIGGNTVAEKRVDLEYFADGQLDAIARYKDLDGGSGNLVAESAYLYDGLGRIAELEHSDGVSVINSYAWAYDANSRVAEVESIDGTSDYSYDATGQVIDVDHSYQADEEFSFDENGNRTMAGYVFGDNNLLLSDGTWEYLYDGEGNTVRKTRISSDPADDHRIDYEWDHRNRLMSALFRRNNNTVSKAFLYFYDTFDRRIVKTVDFDGAGLTFGEKTLRYFREPMPHSGGPGDSTHVAAVLNEEDEVVYRFLHGEMVDQVFAVESAIDGTLWTLTDNQGTVRDIVDSNGAVLNHITYSAFGSIMDETDPTDNLVYYAGREFDRETGDYHNRARQYAPDIGQFRSQDPIGFAGKDTHVQRYVGNAPTLYTDPTGLFPTDEAKAGAHWVSPAERRLLARHRREYAEEMDKYNRSLDTYNRELFAYHQRLIQVLTLIGDELHANGKYGLGQRYPHLFAENASCSDDRGALRGSDGESALDVFNATGAKRYVFPVEWDRLRATMSYSQRHYGDWGQWWLVDGSSFNTNGLWIIGTVPCWNPYIFLNQEQFYGPEEGALADLIHEPLHDYWQFGYGHNGIKEIVPVGEDENDWLGWGPSVGRPKSAYGSDWTQFVDFMNNTTCSGKSLWKRALDWAGPRPMPPAVPTPHPSVE